MKEYSVSFSVIFFTLNIITVRFIHCARGCIVWTITESNYSLVDKHGAVFSPPSTNNVNENILVYVLWCTGTKLSMRRVGYMLYTRSEDTSSFSNLKKKLFIYFWLHWVFVAACGLSLVVSSGGYSLLRCTGFSLRWLLLLRSMGSRRAGFSSCGSRAQ